MYSSSGDSALFETYTQFFILGKNDCHYHHFADDIQRYKEFDGSSIISPNETIHGIEHTVEDVRNWMGKHFLKWWKDTEGYVNRTTNVPRQLSSKHRAYAYENILLSSNIHLKHKCDTRKRHDHGGKYLVMRYIYQTSSHITPVLKSLHFLSVEKSIQYKILFLIYTSVYMQVRRHTFPTFLLVAKILR